MVEGSFESRPWHLALGLHGCDEAVLSETLSLAIPDAREDKKILPPSIGSDLALSIPSPAMALPLTPSLS
jgi:hypothetical protein